MLPRHREAQGREGPLSVLLPPCPAPPHRDQGVPSTQATSSGLCESTRQPKGNTGDAPTRSRWQRQEAARDRDKIGPRQPVSPDASRPSGGCLFPSEPEMHPVVTRGGLASAPQAQVRHHLLYLGHQQPWVPSSVLCSCSPSHMPQKRTVIFTSSS